MGRSIAKCPTALGPVARRQPRRRDGAARQPLRRALFGVGADAEALVAATARLRRPVPLQDRLRPPPRAAAAERRRARRGHRRGPRAASRRSSAGSIDRRATRELRAGARPAARCSIAKRPRAPAATTPTRRPSPREIESLKRWCAAHVHDPRYRGWVVFRFPETLDYDHLVHVAAARSGAARGDGRARRQAAPPRRLQAHRPRASRRARC